MQVLGLLDVLGELCADLVGRDLGGHVWEHVDTALAVYVHWNPGQGAKLSLDLDDVASVDLVGLESIQDDLAVGVGADQAEPASGSSGACDLRQVVGGHAAGVNLQLGRVHLIVALKQVGHQGEKIHSAASESDHIDFFHGLASLPMKILKNFSTSTSMAT